MAQTSVKEQVVKNIDKIKGKVRSIKNALNKPRNDYPVFSNDEIFVIADNEHVLLKLIKIDGKIQIHEIVKPKNSFIAVINLLTGKNAAEEGDNGEAIKLFQVSKNGKEICRLTVGAGLIANIKKSDPDVVLDTWVEI